VHNYLGRRADEVHYHSSRSSHQVGNDKAWNSCAKVHHRVDHVQFSRDEASLCAVGKDSQRRLQIIVWNVKELLESNPSDAAKAHVPVVAKQVSDFPINKLIFSPLDPQVRNFFA
jgi:hypothetical protein